jgi:hypothetical protein
MITRLNKSILDLIEERKELEDKIINNTLRLKIFVSLKKTSKQLKDE